MNSSYLKECRLKVQSVLSITDIIFLMLRIATILGSCFWLLFAPVSTATITSYYIALAVFSVYSMVLYTLIFLRADQIRQIYILSLLLDLVFVFTLVHLENRFDNSFFLGYYLLVVLHSLYFGHLFGFLVATLSACLYFYNIQPFLDTTHWTDPGMRIIFFFLIGMPAGLIHSKLIRDKQEIEKLNRRLSGTIENLRSTQNKLVESEKLSALGRLTAGIAHEIRNPLTSLGGFSRRLAKLMPPNSKEQKYTETIISEVNRLEAILRDILVFTSCGETLRRGDLNHTAHIAVTFYKDLYQNERPVETTEEYLQNLPEIYLEPEQVRQAIGNLISNAIDAMPDGGTLTVKTARENFQDIEWVTLSVQDTGTGMSSKQSELIFEPFFSTKRIATATGLGLTIVHEIMEEHRGFVRVNSSEGSGTTVTLYFPYQLPETEGQIPCWEFLGCGIETDPSRRCSAYPYFGRSCWAIAGTLCQGKVTGTYAGKIDDCRHCSFFQHSHATFDKREAADLLPAPDKNRMN